MFVAQSSQKHQIIYEYFIMKCWVLCVCMLSVKICYSPWRVLPVNNFSVWCDVLFVFNFKFYMSSFPGCNSLVQQRALLYPHRFAGKGELKKGGWNFSSVFSPPPLCLWIAGVLRQAALSYLMGHICSSLQSSAWSLHPIPAAIFSSSLASVSPHFLSCVLSVSVNQIMCQWGKTLPRTATVAFACCSHIKCCISKGVRGVLFQ